ncbi:MAG: response regulator [Bilifractor sp.]
MAYQAKILVVEDDASVRNLITMALQANHYACMTAVNGQEAVMETASANPDVIFLDLGLPDMDGVEVIRKVRSWSKTPIIVISARSEDSDKIAALDEGADDYLTKPFSVEELLARLRVTLRRLYNATPKEDAVFANGKLTVRYAEGTVFWDKQEIHLTPTEYRLLCQLSRNCGKVLTYHYLTQKIWGSSWDGDMASLRVCMATMRKKLFPRGVGQDYIQTHVGIGYRMMRVDKP